MIFKNALNDVELLKHLQNRRIRFCLNCAHLLKFGITWKMSTNIPPAPRLSSYDLLMLVKSIDNRLCADCSAPVGAGDNCFASLSFHVWLCLKCAHVHSSSLGGDDSKIKSLVPLEEWTPEEIKLMQLAPNNSVVNKTLERYIPPSWQKITDQTSAIERSIWIRAKYFSRFFQLPQVMTKASARGGGVRASTRRKSSGSLTLPSRIADFFVVVGVGDVQDVVNGIGNETDLLGNTVFNSTIKTCYPDQQHYSDMPLPDLLGSLVFPDGLHLRKSEQAPVSFTVVLTDISRVKLYCSVLVIHELMNPDELKRKLVTSKHSEYFDPAAMKVVYAPKALVVVSHYGFFHLFSQFLQQIYHVSLSASPVPIERYVVNFISELPLPPQGKTELLYSLPRSQVRISRPPRNRLPMIDFSYRPLFTYLKVDTIITIFSALCSELTVCICSENIALLTPIQEALLSFLFPFIWQGCYVPILPKGMLEILDAPVPLLVGLHDSYLKTVPAKHRPKNVMFVHVETDYIYLPEGDVDMGGSAPVIHPLPKHDLSKLKKKLEEFGGVIYKSPEMCRAMKNAGNPFVHKEHQTPITDFVLNTGAISTTVNARRRMSSVDALVAPSGSGGGASAGTGPSNNAHSRAASPTTSNNNNHFHILDPANNNEVYNDGFNGDEIRNAFLRFFVASFSNYASFFVGLDPPAPEKRTGTFPGRPSLPPKEGRPSISFSADSRSSDAARLSAASSRSSSVDTGTMSKRFRSRSIKNVGKAATMGASGFVAPSFDRDAYKAELQDPFLCNIVDSQLFMNYIQERMDYPEQPEIKFFDESILAKLNRSKFALNKSSTPFLSDDSDALREIFTVPGPSTADVVHGQTFSYASFPEFSGSRFGPVRPPVRLVDQVEIKRLGMSAALADVRAATIIAAFASRKAHSTSGSEEYARNESGGWRDSLLLSATYGRDGANYDESVAAAEEKKLNMIFLSARTHYQQTVAALTVFQSLIRMRAFRNGYQARLRSHIVIKRAVVALQARHRMKRQHNRFLLILRMVCKVQFLFRERRKRIVNRRVAMLQAIIRGNLTRRLQNQKRTHLFAARRMQALHLWAIERTSLAHRSRMWVLVNQPTLLHLALYEDELRRLYHSIGLTDTKSPNFALKNGAQRRSFEEIFKIVQNVYRLGHTVNINMDSVPTAPARQDSTLPPTTPGHVSGAGAGSHMSYPAARSAATDRASNQSQRPISYVPHSTSMALNPPSLLQEVAKASAAREQEERNQLYLILKSQSAAANDSLFRQYNLGVNKKRKQILAATVWTEHDNSTAGARGGAATGSSGSSAIMHADLSAQVVLALLAFRSNADIALQHSKTQQGSLNAIVGTATVSNSGDFSVAGNAHWLQACIGRRVALDAVATVRACMQSIQTLQQREKEAKHSMRILFHKQQQQEPSGVLSNAKSVKLTPTKVAAADTRVQRGTSLGL